MRCFSSTQIVTDACVRAVSKAFTGACEFELVILYDLLLLINNAFAISEIAMLLGPLPFVCAIRVSEALLIHASISLCA